MSRRILPYYQWFPRDFRASTKVMTLSWEEKGIYRELLDIQWDEQGIPEDLSECLRLVRGAKRKSVERVRDLFFVKHPSHDGLLINERLHAMRMKTEGSVETKVNAGKLSGEARRSRSTKAERMFAEKGTDVRGSLNENATTHARENQKLELDNTPLPPKGEAAAPQEGGGLTPEQEYIRDYALRESKGLRHLEEPEHPGMFQGWCEWIEHLKAKAGGKNPPFTTTDRHKRELSAMSGDDALWAIEEAIRRGLPFPADPSKRPASDKITHAPAVNEAEARAAAADPDRYGMRVYANMPIETVPPPLRPRPRPENPATPSPYSGTGLPAGDVTPSASALV